MNEHELLEVSLGRWLKGNGLDSLRLSISRPMDRDATNIQLATTVYAQQEISGLQMHRMDRIQTINYVENAARAMMLQMASVCEDMAEKLREGAR